MDQQLGEHSHSHPVTGELNDQIAILTILKIDESWMMTGNHAQEFNSCGDMHIRSIVVQNTEDVNRQN